MANEKHITLGQLLRALVKQGARDDAQDQALQAMDEKNLDAAELPAAIEEALAQAKESGEFGGASGADGVSPVVDVVDFEGGHRVTITDADGAKSFDVMDGSPGADGEKGADGTSVTHEWNGTVLSVTSASGTSSADLKGEKGDKGDKGEDGTMTFADLTEEQKASLKGADGANGTDGADGEDGATFTPSVSESGDLSWSNDKGLENPATVNIKGEKGDTGDTGPQGEQGPAGTDGYTPVKGTDYFTDEDKTELVNAVIAALPTWTGGSY